MWVLYIDGPRNFIAGYEEAKRIGLNVGAVLTSQSSRTGLSYDISIDVQSFELEDVVRAISQWQHRNEIIGFLALHDAYGPLAARLNEHFSTMRAFTPFEAALGLKDKGRLRYALRNTDLNPEYKIVSSYDERHKFSVHSESGKWVVKPTLGYSSIGVELIHSIADLRQAFERSSATLAGIRKSVPSVDGALRDTEGSLLFEEYIDGSEYSVETVTTFGETTVVEICGKSKMVEPWFEEVSYTAPGDIPQNDRLRLCESAKVALNALGVTNGVCHLEFRVTPNRIVLLDVGLRIGGAGLSHALVFLSSGQSLAGAQVRGLAGIPVEPSLLRSKADIAVLYLMQIRAGGKLLRFPISSVLARPEIEVVERRQIVSEGDVLFGYPSYSGLPGYVLSRIKGNSVKSYELARQFLEDCPAMFDPLYVKSNPELA